MFDCILVVYCTNFCTLFNLRGLNFRQFDAKLYPIVFYVSRLFYVKLNSIITLCFKGSIDVTENIYMH